MGGSQWSATMLNKRNLVLSLLGAAVLVTSPVAASAEKILKNGAFTGKSGHVTSGSVSIVRTSDGIEVRLGSSFKLDSAPDPWLGFGNNGKYDSASEIAILKSHNGSQIYRIAALFDRDIIVGLEVIHRQEITCR